MAALPGSGQLSLDDIIKNRTGAAGTNVSLKDESEAFASGSIVAGSGAQTSARYALDAEPYAISEFYDADFPSAIITGITFTTAGGTTGYGVDGEDLVIAFTCAYGAWGDYVVSFLDSVGDTIGSATVTVSSGTSGNYTWSALNVGAGTYRPRVRFGTFNVEDDNSTFVWYDKITGASINSVSTQYVNSSTGTNPITFGYSNTNGIVTSRAWTFTNATNGNGSAVSITESAGVTPAVTFTGTGTFPIGLSLYGNPSNTRNVDTDSINVNVQYVNAIDSITQSQGNVNVYAVDGADNATFTCYSEGYDGTLTIGYDDNDSTSDTDLLGSGTEPVDTIYQREYINKSLTISSAGTYYPKAYHDGSAVVGSSFIVAPALGFSTTGDDSISAASPSETSHTFKATSPVGRNFSMTISNNFNSTTTTNYGTGFALSPGTADGQYTITYNASADFSQTGPDQTDILDVYPVANYTINSGDTTLLINSPAGSGLTDDSLQLNATTSVGDNISAYLFKSLLELKVISLV